MMEVFGLFWLSIDKSSEKFNCILTNFKDFREEENHNLRTPSKFITYLKLQRKWVFTWKWYKHIWKFDLIFIFSG